MQVEIIREDETKLQRKRWSFYVLVEHFGEVSIRLNHYAEESRETTRKRTWTASRTYSSYEARRTPAGQRCTPELPDDVRDEVRQRVLSAIVFKEVV